VWVGKAEDKNMCEKSGTSPSVVRLRILCCGTSRGGAVYSEANIQERFRALVDLGSFFLFRMSADWDELISLEGRGELADLPLPATDWINRLIPEQDRASFLDGVKRHCLEATSFELDHQILRADGAIGWVRMRATPIKAVDGRIIEWLGAMSDITELKDEQARQAFLLAWNDQVNPLVAPECVMHASAAALGKFLGAGRVRYIEMDENSMSYSRSAEWINPEMDLQPIEERFTLAQFSPDLIRRVETGQSLVTSDVRKDPVFASQADLFEANQIRAGILVPLIKEGRLSGALSVHMPTARHWRPFEIQVVKEVAERTWSAVQRAKAEARLRDATASMQLALQVADLMPWQLLLPERLLVSSSELLNALKLPSSARLIPDETLLSFVHPEDRARRSEAVEAAIANQGAFDIEYRMIFEGRTHWVRMIGRHDCSNGQDRLIGVAQDITARRVAEEQQRLDAERLRLIFDSAHDYAIIALDLDGGITSWNSGAERILGYQEEEALGQPVSIFFTPEDVAEDVAGKERERTDIEGRAINERWHVRKDGSRFWASGLMVPLQNGRQHGYLKIFRDLTEKRRSEESLDLLVDELNHRVKNTLATVQSICRQTLRNAAVPVEVQSAITSRLGALAASHDLLTREHWAGASMRELMDTVLAPFIGALAAEQVKISGPSLMLTPKSAVALSIAIHELGANAVKHGSLSTSAGTLAVNWSVDDKALDIVWLEQGATLPSRKRRGFGSRVIEEALVYDLQAEASMKFDAEGLRLKLHIPLEGNVR
jgi:PAS domain S-box-containing protein